MLCLDVGGGSDGIREWRGVKRARCSGVLSLMDRFFEKQVCKHVNCCGCIALWSDEDTVSVELKISACSDILKDMLVPVPILLLLLLPVLPLLLLLLLY